MKTTPKLNVRLLRRIQKHIMEEPRRFFMREHMVFLKPGSAVNSDGYWEDQTVPKCGTVACIAGWAVLLSQKTRRKLSWEVTRRRADALIGLNFLQTGGDVEVLDERHPLFRVENWPESFADDYNEATSVEERAKIAAARIEHLIKTGE